MSEKQTDSGIKVEPLYTSESLAGFDAKTKLGNPGEAPFTRGIYKTMHRERLWTMRQYAGFGTAADTNERFKFLLAQGQTGLSTAFDMPTLMGYDSDSDRALGEVFNVGTGVETWVNELATLLGRIVGVEAPPQHTNRRDIDNIRRRVVNIEKARRALRWVPSMTLEDGLRATVAWQRAKAEERAGK